MTSGDGVITGVNVERCRSPPWRALAQKGKAPGCSWAGTRNSRGKLLLRSRDSYEQSQPIGVFLLLSLGIVLSYRITHHGRQQGIPREHFCSCQHRRHQVSLAR